MSPSLCPSPACALSLSLSLSLSVSKTNKLQKKKKEVATPTSGLFCDSCGTGKTLKAAGPGLPGGLEKINAIERGGNAIFLFVNQGVMVTLQAILSYSELR